jgi:hypothetical protein
VTGWLRQVTQPPFIAGPLGFIAVKKTDYRQLRQFIMTLKYYLFIGISPSTSFIVTWPACSFAHLHMTIQRFCFLKFTKPDDEHHLQVFHPFKPGTEPFIGTLKAATKPNGVEKN